MCSLKVKLEVYLSSSFSVDNLSGVAPFLSGGGMNTWNCFEDFDKTS